MVSLSGLAVVLFAIVRSLAAPTGPAAPVGRGLVEERGSPDLVLGNKTDLARRQNYNQDYTTGGTVNYGPTSNGYWVTWNTEDDFVVGKGWTTGSTK